MMKCTQHVGIGSHIYWNGLPTSDLQPSNHYVYLSIYEHWGFGSLCFIHALEVKVPYNLID